MSLWLINLSEALLKKHSHLFPPSPPRPDAKPLERLLNVRGRVTNARFLLHDDPFQVTPQSP
jgi:hypothetical protein